VTDTTFVKRLLAEQRSRTLGSILGYVDRQPWRNKLTEPEFRLLKEKIMQLVGGYHDTCLDILKASGLENDTAVLNELALTAMRDLNHRMAKLQRSLDATEE